MGRKKTKIEKYKYKVEETIIYIGKFYENYTNKEGIILSRSSPHKESTYKIEFIKDKKILSLEEKFLQLK